MTRADRIDLGIVLLALALLLATGPVRLLPGFVAIFALPATVGTVAGLVFTRLRGRGRPRRSAAVGAAIGCLFNPISLIAQPMGLADGSPAYVIQGVAEFAAVGVVVGYAESAAYLGVRRLWQRRGTRPAPN